MKHKITKDDPDWHDSPDAMVWAEKFVETVKANPDTADPLDAGFMVTWFAGAMGADERNRRIASASDPDGGRIVVHVSP